MANFAYICAKRDFSNVFGSETMNSRRVGTQTTLGISKKAAGKEIFYRVVEYFFSIYILVFRNRYVFSVRVNHQTPESPIHSLVRHPLFKIKQKFQTLATKLSTVKPRPQPPFLFLYIASLPSTNLLRRDKPQFKKSTQTTT